MKFNVDPDSLQPIAKKIQMLLLDVDGVFTDGRLYFTNSGEEFKSFHTLDGHGIKMLMSIGVEVGIITGRQSAIVARRCTELGIKLIYQGREDKLEVLHEIVAARAVALHEIAYAGDDLPDLPVLRTVGLGFTVPAGHRSVKAVAHAITEAPGGLGAVREITDFLLEARGAYARFLV